MEYDDGSTVTYTYDDAGNRTQVARAGPFNTTIQITGTGPVNLRTLANNAGYDGAQSATITFEVGSGVTITGAAGAPNGGVAVDTGTWPFTTFTTSLSLVIKSGGKIYGGGGSGGLGAARDGVPGQADGSGGDALYCSLPCTITVESGAEVRGGGGGGGGGGGWGRQVMSSGQITYYNGGGGGGGFPNGPGGLEGQPPTTDVSSPGAAGNGAGGGAGGSGGTAGPGRTTGAGATGGGAATGGAAGNASAGNEGIFLGFNNWKIPPGGSTAAGYAVRQNGHTVNVTNNGTITGAVG